MMAHFRPGLVPTFVTLVMVTGCLMLGSWQIDRLAWKNDLVSRMEAGRAADPVALPDLVTDPATWEYRRVTASGDPLSAQPACLFGRSRAGGVGRYVFMPLRQTDGAILFINLGWVPQKDGCPVVDTGLLDASHSGLFRRASTGGAFTPAANNKTLTWFTRDVIGMAEGLKLEGAVRPYYIDADARAEKGSFPLGGQTNFQIVNNHLQYVVTWFSFAVILMIIYVIYGIKQAREGAARD